MYEDDTPPAERRAQALSLDRDLLRELLGQEELRDLLDADAVDEVERQLRGDPRTPDQLHDKLRLRGDLRAEEYDAGLAAPLLEERRALVVRIAGEERLIAVEDAGRYRDALGVMPPSGLPDVFLEGGPESLRQLVLRFAKGHGPFTTAQANERFGRAVEDVLVELEQAEQLVRGELRPGGVEREWCDPDVLRTAAARLARSAAPRGRTGRPGGARAVPALVARGRPARVASRSARTAAGPAAARRALGVRGPAEARPRLPAGASRCAHRERRGGLGRRGPRPRRRSTSARTLRRSARCRRRRDRKAPSTTGSVRRSPGALFWDELLLETGLADAIALPALWDLVWAGEVTNDAWTPLRAARRFASPKLERRPRRFSRRRVQGPTATAGRWSRTERLFGGAPDRRALAELLLERQGIVTRDGVRAEGIPGGYGAVYAELRALETLGSCRRGYFVEGLGGAQFALGGAVERLRELRDRDQDGDALVLAAADPAQPYGAALPWPRRAGARAARVAGAYLVSLGGEPVLYVERGGRSLVPLRDPDDAWLRPALAALVAHVRAGGVKRLAVERFDGEPVVETDAMQLLVDAGFLAGPRRAVLRA